MSSKVEDSITQDVIESYMVGEGWTQTISIINTLIAQEDWVAVLNIVGWALKPIPFISFFGYACDLVSLIVDFLKWTPRDELYQFLLDPANYPTTALYEKKVATFTATINDTRLMD